MLIVKNVRYVNSGREKTAARTSVILSNSLRKDEDVESKIATSLLKAQD